MAGSIADALPCAGSCVSSNSISSVVNEPSESIAADRKCTRDQFREIDRDGRELDGRSISSLEYRRIRQLDSAISMESMESMEIIHPLQVATAVPEDSLRRARARQINK